jgi:hypothetical protein
MCLPCFGGRIIGRVRGMSNDAHGDSGDIGHGMMRFGRSYHSRRRMSGHRRNAVRLCCTERCHRDPTWLSQHARESKSARRRGGASWRTPGRRGCVAGGRSLAVLGPEAGLGSARGGRRLDKRRDSSQNLRSHRRIRFGDCRHA